MAEGLAQTAHFASTWFRDSGRQEGEAAPNCSRTLATSTPRVVNGTAAAEVFVGDLTASLEKSQPTISHHMKVLVEAGLAQGDPRGKWVSYSLNRERLARIKDAIDLSASTMATDSSSSWGAR